MSVLVTMQVGPVDWGKFRSGLEWLKEQEAPGLHSSNAYQSDSDPATVLIVEEWDSHDAWHDFAGEVGEEFMRRSGAEELDWQDNVWNASDAPSPG